MQSRVVIADTVTGRFLLVRSNPTLSSFSMFRLDFTVLLAMVAVTAGQTYSGHMVLSAPTYNLSWTLTGENGVKSLLFLTQVPRHRCLRAWERHGTVQLVMDGRDLGSSRPSSSQRHRTWHGRGRGIYVLSTSQISVLPVP